jgi:hypothetical protein
LPAICNIDQWIGFNAQKVNILKKDILSFFDTGAARGVRTAGL